VRTSKRNIEKQYRTGRSVCILAGVLIFGFIFAVGNAVANSTNRDPDLIGTDGSNFNVHSSEVLSTFRLPNGIVRSLALEADMIAARVEGPNKTSVVVFKLGGDVVFRYSRDNTAHPGIAAIDLSRDGSRVVIMERAEGDWDWKQSVFSMNGRRVFESQYDTRLIPSPNGKFFVHVYNDVANPPFKVLDSIGTSVQLPVEFTVELNKGWNAAFLADELIVVASRESLWMIDLASSTILREFDLDKSIFIRPPLLVCSQDDAIVAAYNSKRIHIFDSSGTPLWSDFPAHCLGGVTFSADHKLVALQQFYSGAGPGYVELCSVEDPESRYRSDDISEISNCVWTRFEVSWLSEGMYSFLNPITSDLTFMNPSTEFSTVFIPFDFESHQSGKPIVVDGIYLRLDQREYTTPAFIRLVQREQQVSLQKIRLQSEQR
jgi:hypothetical protein